MAAQRDAWEHGKWLQALAEARSSGKLGRIQNLLKLVQQHTDLMVRRRIYRVAAGVEKAVVEVNLGDVIPPRAEAFWLSKDSVNVQQHAIMSHRTGKIAPPLVVCSTSTLDVALEMRNLDLKRGTVLVVEVSDFDENGAIPLGRLSPGVLQCLLLRSDFRRVMEVATAQLRRSQATAQQHLCAERDPYVIWCPKVTIFRGPREDGYPLLQEPIQTAVLVMAMAERRPGVAHVFQPGGSSEWYSREADHTALFHRMNLVALVALQESKNPMDETSPPQVQAEESNSEYDPQFDTAPTIVLPALGCGGYCPHPKHAISSSFKSWRKRFAPFFHTVFLCTNEGTVEKQPPLALHLHGVVNTQVTQMDAEGRLGKAMPWHWSPEELRLSFLGSKLLKVAKALEEHRIRKQALVHTFAAKDILPTLLRGEDPERSSNAGSLSDSGDELEEQMLKELRLKGVLQQENSLWGDDLAGQYSAAAAMLESVFPSKDTEEAAEEVRSEDVDETMPVESNEEHGDDEGAEEKGNSGGISGIAAGFAIRTLIAMVRDQRVKNKELAREKRAEKQKRLAAKEGACHRLQLAAEARRKEEQVEAFEATKRASLKDDPVLLNIAEHGRQESLLEKRYSGANKDGLGVEDSQLQLRRKYREELSRRRGSAPATLGFNKGRRPSDALGVGVALSHDTGPEAGGKRATALPTGLVQERQKAQKLLNKPHPLEAFGSSAERPAKPSNKVKRAYIQRQTVHLGLLSTGFEGIRAGMQLHSSSASIASSPRSALVATAAPTSLQDFHQAMKSHGAESSSSEDDLNVVPTQQRALRRQNTTGTLKRGEEKAADSLAPGNMVIGPPCS